MNNTLAFIGAKLNQEKVTWAVGASILLNYHGLIDAPHDIDLLVSLEDIEKVDVLLSRLGEKLRREKTDNYSTEYFYEYEINGVDIDVMSGLKINFEGGTFSYAFDSSSVAEVIKISDVDIPLMSLEDWFVIYQLIPNREVKVNLIETYFIEHGLKNPQILEKALTSDLPQGVRTRIKRVMGGGDS